MSQQLLEDSCNDPIPSADEIIINILEEVGNLSNFMEVFYFSREPDCLAVLRWLSMLSDAERQQLGQFAKLARAGDALRVVRPQPNTLMLMLMHNEEVG